MMEIEKKDLFKFTASASGLWRVTYDVAVFNEKNKFPFTTEVIGYLYLDEGDQVYLPSDTNPQWYLSYKTGVQQKRPNLGDLV